MFHGPQNKREHLPPNYSAGHCPSLLYNTYNCGYFHPLTTFNSPSLKTEWELWHQVSFCFIHYNFSLRCSRTWGISDLQSHFVPHNTKTCGKHYPVVIFSYSENCRFFYLRCRFVVRFSCIIITGMGNLHPLIVLIVVMLFSILPRVWETFTP